MFVYALAKVTVAALFLSSAVPTDISVTDAPIAMLFLQQQARDAARRSSGARGADSKSRAARLQVTVAEVQVIDRNAIAYEAEDRRIHEDALKYRQTCVATHNGLDPMVIHSFTLRRISQAQAAFRKIQLGLSPRSYMGLQGYLSSEFQRSIKRTGLE